MTWNEPRKPFVAKHPDKTIYDKEKEAMTRRRVRKGDHSCAYCGSTLVYCTECGTQIFSSLRAKTCSNACRQKRYQRKRADQ